LSSTDEGCEWYQNHPVGVVESRPESARTGAPTTAAASATPARRIRADRRGERGWKEPSARLRHIFSRSIVQNSVGLEDERGPRRRADCVAAERSTRLPGVMREMPPDWLALFRMV